MNLFFVRKAEMKEVLVKNTALKLLFITSFLLVGKRQIIWCK